jgi:hypothetical protein
MNDVDDYPKSRTAAAAWRIVGRHAAACEAKVPSRSNLPVVTGTYCRHSDQPEHALARGLLLLTLRTHLLDNPAQLVQASHAAEYQEPFLAVAVGDPLDPRPHP